MTPEFSLRSQLESGPVVHLVTGPSGLAELRFVSRPVKTLTGYDAERFLRDRTFWLDRTHSEDRSQVREVLGRLNDAEQLSFDHRFRHADGSWRHMAVHLVPVRSAVGVIREVVGTVTDITLGAEIEKTLLLMEERLRVIVEESIQGVLVHRNWKPLYANQSYAKILGYDSPAEVLALESILQVYAPHERSRLGRYQQARLAGRDAPSMYEYDALRKDGSRITLQNLVRVVHWEGEIATLHTCIDVTERRMAEDALRKSESLFRQAEQIANIGHWEWDEVEDRLVSCSQQCARINGMSVEQTLEAFSSFEKLLAVIHPDDRARYLQVVLDGDRKATPVNHEFRIVTPDGSVRHVKEMAMPVVDDSGKPVRSMGTIQDITERKLAENRLRESEDRLQQAARLAKLGHWEWDKVDDRLAACSEQFAEILEMSIEDAVATFASDDAWLNIIHPDDRDEYIAERAEADAKLAPLDQQYRIITPAGTIRWVYKRAKPFVDGRGVLVRTVGTLQDVTELKTLEEKVRQSQARLRAFIDHSPDPVFIKDSEGRFSLVNRRSESLLAMSEGEILGKTVHELYPSELADYLSKFDRMVINERKAVWHETRLESDGREYIFDTVKFPIVDPGDGRVHVGGIDHDITERRIIEETLRKREQELRLITNNLPALIVYFDVDCRYRFVNSTAESWYGRSADMVVGKHPAEILGEHNWARLAPHMRHVLNGEAHEFDVTLDYPDGVTRGTHQTFTPHFSPSGDVIGFYAMALDISDRQRAEAALKQSEHQLRLIADSLPVLILYFDKDLRYRFVNRTAERWYARSRKEIIGKRSPDILGKTAFKRLGAYFEKALQGTDGVYEERIKYPDGVTRDVLAIYVPDRDTGERVRGLYVLVMDLTERRAAEELVRRSRQNLRKLAERLEQTRETERKKIAYEVHDDFGQILTALKFAVSEILKDDRDHPTDLASEREFIFELFDKLFQKVRSLAKRLRPGHLDDIGLEEAVAMHLEEMSGQTGWKYRFDFDLNGSLLQKAHETIVFRLIQEALTNAARHAGADSIDVSIRERRGQVVAEVIDNGRGITPAQLKNPESVGLTGMRERAGSVGGRLEIRRAPSRGTRVTLRLPLSADKKEKGDIQNS